MPTHKGRITHKPMHKMPSGKMMPDSEMAKMHKAMPKPKKGGKK